jgi:stage II sporulation protein D
MSQNGAHSMAKAGKTYKDILDFFYHGAEIRTE